MKEIVLLKDKEITLYESQKLCHICKQKFCNDKNKKSEYAPYHKSEIIVIAPGKFRGAAHNICNRFIQSKLSDLADNLAKINKKGCPKCKGKCEFIVFENDRLH